MFNRCLFVATLACGLAACGTGNFGISGPEALRAKQVLAQNCIINRSSGDAVDTQRKITEDIIVYSVSYGEENWVSSDVSTRGLRDNIFYNLKTGKVVCGRRNWNDSGRVFERAEIQQPPAANLLHQRFRDIPSTRKLTVNWDGFEPIERRIDLAQGRNQNTFEIPIPAPDGPCIGTYKPTDRTRGTWVLTCQGGLIADGTYQALGSGKGARGQGEDNRGRKLTYTIGPAGS
ncbi:MAG: hypothetical protein ACPGOV_12860 [Magnetovibrionaceae bacterium]